MEITEKSAEGLDRRFLVKVDADELDRKLTERLRDMKKQVHLKGFRKGKAPVSFLKKRYGKGVMGEIVRDIVTETSQTAFSGRNLRPAALPRPHFHTSMEDIIAGKSGLEYDLHAEILPEVPPLDAGQIELVRPVADVSPEDIEQSLAEVARGQTRYETRDADACARKGDMIVIDFTGKTGGREFDGGKGEGVSLVLGDSSFIPGFEEQLEGAKAGERRNVSVTFPDDYGSAALAGKDAVFDVTVTGVSEPREVPVDDALARMVGLDTLEELKKRLGEQLAGRYRKQTRAHMKRALLDRLDELFDFELPRSMVDAEFEQIWRQAGRQDAGDGGADDGNATEDAGAGEDLKEEYRQIAIRRVRLGLVLAETGREANIQVPTEDIRREMIRTARSYPGKEQEILDFYKKNPAAVEQLRAPLFEEKVVDYIFERAKVTEEKVSREFLMQDPGDDLPGDGTDSEDAAGKERN